MSGQVKFTPLGTLISILLIVGLIGLGLYLVTGQNPLASFTGKPKAPAVAEKQKEGGPGFGSSRPGQATQTAVLARVRQNGVLRVGMEPEAPPMNFVDAQGKRRGFDWEVAQLLARRIGASRVEVVEADYNDLPAKLRSGAIDVMMGGYVADPGVAKVDWTNGYLDFGLCLIVKQGSAVREPKHLAGRTVGIYSDPAAKEWLLANAPGVLVKEFEYTGWFKELDSGNVEAIVYDYPFAVEEIKPFPRLKIVKLNLNASAYSIGIPSGNTDLLDALNDAIQAVTGSAEFEALVKAYLRSEQIQVAALPAGSKTYQVKPGDTLSRIAEAELGSVQAWPRIWDLNKTRIPNPHLIEVGFQLLMP